MLLYDPVADCEAETGAVSDAFGRKERVEDLVQVLFGNTFACIGDLDIYLTRGVDVGCQRNASAAEHCIACVEDQIRKYLLELAAIAKDQGRRGRVLLRDLDIRF